MADSNQGIPLKGKLRKMSCLHSKKRKKLVKRTHQTDQKKVGTTLIGSIVAEIFNPKDTSKLLSQHFLSTLKGYNSASISPIHLIHHIILNQLFELFSAVGSVSQINKIGKNALAGFGSMVKSLCAKWAY